MLLNNLHKRREVQKKGERESCIHPSIDTRGDVVSHLFASLPPIDQAVMFLFVVESQFCLEKRSKSRSECVVFRRKSDEGSQNTNNDFSLDHYHHTVWA
mmetsp:Transcript_6558/g.9577  ORF Transcript_6558/g.9577 Transcript_6558/m.9577 type:complete len:99 (-) Transcript_6558:491-787(-)